GAGLGRAGAGGDRRRELSGDLRRARRGAGAPEPAPGAAVHPRAVAGGPPGGGGPGGRTGGRRGRGRGRRRPGGGGPGGGGRAAGVRVVEAGPAGARHADAGPVDARAASGGPAGAGAGAAGAGAAVRPTRLLLTCRTHYFRSIRDEVGYFTGQDRDGPTGRQHLALLMLPFNDEQIRRYLTTNVPGADVDALLASMGSVHDLRELAERPLTLSYVTEQLELIEQAKLDGRTLRTVDL